MKTLILPEEVVTLAFNANPAIEPAEIPESLILAAQQKFIKPVLGGLYDALHQEDYSSLLCDYVKPALALYVKLLMLPSMSVQTGIMGIVRWKGENFAPADNKYISILSKTTRSQANALMRRAVEHIEATPENFEGYSAEENILNRISICSSIVL